LADFRKEYSDRGLRRDDLKADPIQQFEDWFKTATDVGVHEPNAMTLSTVGATGAPLQRTVLLKGYDGNGFVFFSNYQSRKAADIDANPQVCLLFPWLTLERQVIIQGRAEKTTVEESTAYFHSRPPESQIGAWVSNQSEVISSREVLNAKLNEIRERFKDTEIPLPPFWGGYRVIPSTIEFWQGGPARLHDRFLYSRTSDGWKIERLSP
ncbi:MAG: pyridoxamine 5-phosphate oxidase, partial [Verrucomicrobiota bacterium]